MDPISASFLPHSVTLYNAFRDDGGATRRHRTLLERVRVGTFKNGASAGRDGPRPRFSLSVLVDPRTTRGWGLSPDGTRTPKGYLPKREWLGAAHEERAVSWTLRPTDWLFALAGERESIGPEFGPDDGEQRFRTDNDIMIMAEVNPVMDMDGTIHHWKVFFD
jgi:hypothetical protein